LDTCVVPLVWVQCKCLGLVDIRLPRYAGAYRCVICPAQRTAEQEQNIQLLHKTR
jgi:hypothetical protein